MNSYALGIAAIFVLVVGVLIMPADSSNIPPTPAFKTIQTNDTSTTASVTANSYNDILNFNSDGTVLLNATQGVSGLTNPYPDWDYRRTVTIDGSLFTGSHTDFPILVDITNSHLGSNAQSSGADIFFTSNDGTTVLPHEIDEYDNLTGDLTAWIKVDVSDSTDLELYMYYGNDDVLLPSQEDVCNVWSNNYVLVVHMTNGGANSVCGENTSTDVGPVDTTGKISTAQAFDGLADTFDYNDMDSLDGFEELTVSAWVKYANTKTSSEKIMLKDKVFQLDVGQSADTARFYIRQGTTWFNTGASTTTLNDDDWHHVLGRYDNADGIEIFVNSVEENQTLVALTTNSETSDVHIASSKGTASFWDENLDEVRAQTVARSDDWITTEFTNQDNPASYITLGAVEDFQTVDNSIDFSIGGYFFGNIFTNDTSGMTNTVTADTLNDTLSIISDGSILINGTDGSIDDPFPDFAKRMKVTVSKDMVVENVTGFPLYIPLQFVGGNEPTALSYNDVFFTSGDKETILPHEKSYAFTFLGEYDAWVKTDLSSVEDTILYVYYGGDTFTPDQSDPCPVWEDYQLVMHFDSVVESLTYNSVCGEDDPTNHGANTVSSQVTSAASFDGISDYIEWVDHPDLEGAINMTATAWHKADVTTGDNVIISKFDTASSDWSFMMMQEASVGGETNTYRCMVREDAGTLIQTYGLTDDVVQDTWQHVACTFIPSDSSGLRTLMNATEINTSPVSSVGTLDIQSTDIPYTIGATNIPSRYLDGAIDEIRIINSTLSDGWIETEFNNQNTSLRVSTSNTHPYISLDAPESLPFVTSNQINIQSNQNAWGIIIPHTDEEAVFANGKDDTITFDSADDTILITGNDVNDTIITSNGTVADTFKISDTEGGFTYTFASGGGEQFGSAVASIGDINNDGYVDIAVGASGIDDNDDGGGEVNGGAVFILLLNGTSNVLDYQKISETSGNFTGDLGNNARFGESIIGMGDLDGDTIPDISVGAPTSTATDPQIFNLYLHANGTVKKTIEISNSTVPADLDIHTGELGWDIDNIGDLNGDGYDDLIAGDPFDADGGFSTGAVYVLFLNSTSQVYDYQKISDLSGNFTATLDANDEFGHGVASVGDVNGDGISDFAVGAPLDDDPFTVTDRGAVYIIFPNTDGTVKDYQKISASFGNFTATLDGNDFFGYDVTGMGDLDGNGIPDIMVTALDDDDGGTDIGAVYTLFLNGDGTVKNWKKISDTEGGFTETLDDFEQFGESLSWLEDINGDGLIDFLIGAPLDDDGTAGRGAMYVVTSELNTIGNLTDTINFKLNYPGTDRIGGVKAQSCSASEYVIGIDTNGNIICSP